MSRKVPLSIKTPLSETFVVESMVAEEDLSGLYHIDVSLVTTDTAVDFDAIVGKDVTLTVERFSGTPRYFHGMVARFKQGGRSEGNQYYRAEVVPKLWLLTLSIDYRIFQEKTVPAIVKELLKEHGVTDVSDELTGTYSPREYCVQYGETAFDFVSRLMEEEGIFYFFEHVDGKHTLVLGDDASAHTALAPEEVPLMPAHASREVEDSIVECGYQRQLVTGSSTVLDYNFETPTNKLKSTVAGTATTGKFEAVENPGGFGKKDAGDRIAKLRAEAHELPATELSGYGFARAFTAGHKFKLAKHPRADFNQGYILRRVHHTATQDGYQNSFEAFPQSVPYRPARRTPPPRVYGPQTAVVVGASGEKIYTDKYGRIKVQFHWDRRGKADDKSSCWIRVAQGWAGKSFGSFFLPRVGQEVLVTFLDGDVDRPIVSGSVYNAQQVVPYELPANQTRSLIKTQTEGSVHNELRFEDKKDVEEVWVQAAKDFKADVVNDRTWTVGHDSVEKVKNDRTATIEEGNEKLVVTKGNRTVEIAEGDETLTVKKGKRTVDVQKGDEIHKVEGKRTVTITGAEERSAAKVDWSTEGNYTLKISGDVVIDATGSITLKAGKDVKIQAGNDLTSKANNITNDAAIGLKNKAGTKLDNEAGGTLNNKSNGMQTVEASGILNVKTSAILNVQGSMVKIN
ncbi:MAG: type VI secretion system tip protein TssI/VgrG [Gemmatimonadota bacterium]